MDQERKRVWRNRLLAVGMVAGAIVLVVVMAKLRPAPQKKPAAVTEPLIATVPLTQRDVQFVIAAQGTVEPRHETTLVAEVAGVVRELSEAFVAGGVFKRGDTLLVIDPHDYAVAVKQAQANLANAQAKLTEELARAEVAKREWEKLYAEGQKPTALALRQPFVEQAQAAVKSAEADLANAERKLTRTVIRAPYDGMVKAKRIDLGQYVNIGSQLVVIFATDKAEVRLPIPDTELAFLPVQQVGQLTQGPHVELSSQFGGQRQTWSARITRIEGVVDSRSRMHYLVAEIRDPYGLANKAGSVPLKMGTFVRAEIDGRVANGVHVLPRAQLRGDDRVLVVDSNRQLRFRTVDVIRADAENVYVGTGLLTGDQVVVTALEAPVDGMHVRIADAAPSVSETADIKPDAGTADNGNAEPGLAAKPAQ